MKILYIIILFCSVSLISVRSLGKDFTYVSHVDKAIYLIYNMEFNKAEKEIDEISKSSPETAKYIRLEFLWWKMIAFHSEITELGFLESLNSLTNNDDGEPNSDYNKLFYFTYCIRYHNLQERYLQKMASAVKFHLFLNQWEKEGFEAEESFIQSFKTLTLEMNKYMKFRIFDKFNFLSNKNKHNDQYYLKKIESLNNPEFDSFNVVKTYLLAKIYLEIEKKPTLAHNNFKALSIKFPNNTVFKEYVKGYQNKSL